jgi:hypothetical protein
LLDSAFTAFALDRMRTDQSPQRFLAVKHEYTVLTLSACAEYIYSAASHASHPDGVLILRDFHKVVK